MLDEFAGSREASPEHDPVLRAVEGERRPVAVVTGGSAGVGRATAVALSHAGFDVGLIARGEDGLRGAVDDVLAHGGRALAVQADVALFADVRRAAAEIEQHLGPIDVWINDAMATVFAPVWELDPAELRRATEVTYLGQVHGTLAALELMRPRNHGTIVSVGSALAFRGIPLQSAYCGAKFAVRGFMQSVRTELLHEGSDVRITTVHLPAVNTPQFRWSRSRMPAQPQPVPPVYSPEVAARAIVAAARRAPRQRIVGTWNWLIIQGNKVMPGVFDHYAARTGWQSQQVAGTHAAPRQGNLRAPLDEAAGTDRGSTGVFADRAHGVLDPTFVSSLPGVLQDVRASIADRAREVWTGLTGAGGTRRR